MLRAAILDNSAIARGLLRTILVNSGYDVISESGIASANLSRLTLLAPQLVFIAIDPEGQEAHFTLAEMRNRLPKALIFAMSSSFTTEMISGMGTQDANGFIVKPFNASAVLSSIRKSILAVIAQQRIVTKL